MEKRTSFGSLYGPGWPTSAQLETSFFASQGDAWFRAGGNDTGSFALQGVDGTAHLKQGNGRRDIRLQLWGHPQYGVVLIYGKTGEAHFSSKGDSSQINVFVRTLHEDLMPLWLYIPFEKAWLAVKEFLDTGGALPTSIEWIDNKRLPENTFPVPHHVPGAGERILEKS